MNDSSNHKSEKPDQKTRRINNQIPCLVWFTGISGAGKTTMVRLVEKKLIGLGMHPYAIDGDLIRKGLCKDLGFDDKSRVENIRRVSEVALMMVDAGLIVLASFISPFAAERSMVRNLVGNHRFIEVFMDTPLEIAEKQDTKGLYRRVRSGEIKNFTAIDSPYEAPESPELRLTAGSECLEDMADQVVTKIINIQSDFYL